MLCSCCCPKLGFLPADDSRMAATIPTIKRVLGLTGDPGLLSEEYGLGSKRLAGSFPQTLSHIALVNALLALERATSVGDGTAVAIARRA